MSGAYKIWFLIFTFISRGVAKLALTGRSRWDMLANGKHTQVFTTYNFNTGLLTRLRFGRQLMHDLPILLGACSSVPLHFRIPRPDL